MPTSAVLIFWGVKAGLKRPNVYGNRHGAFRQVYVTFLDVTPEKRIKEFFVIVFRVLFRFKRESNVRIRTTTTKNDRSFLGKSDIHI